jgi:hypothetical protein
MAQTDGFFTEIGYFRLIWAIAGGSEEPHQYSICTPYIVLNHVRSAYCATSGHADSAKHIAAHVLGLLV